MRLYSKLAEYAIRSLVVLATDRVWRMRVHSICERDGLPLHFTRKAMQLMARHKILEAARGPQGGYVFKISPEKIRLLDVIRIFDSLETSNPCPCGETHCTSEKPCVLRKFQIRMEEKTMETLQKISIADLVKKRTM